MIRLLLAIATLAAPATGDPTRAIAAGFDSAPLVVHVRDAASLRRGGQLGIVVDSLGELARFDAVETSWSRLSIALGWDGGEAFDRLLGESFVLVVEDWSRPDAWTLACAVSRDTARHVSSQLRAVPKSQLAGVPVFGIEGDEIAASMVELGDGSILLFTRDPRLASFKRVVQLARGHGGAGPEGFPEGQIAVVVRDVPTKDSMIAAGASQRPGGWHIRAQFRSGEVWDALMRDCRAWAAPADADDDPGALFRVNLPLSLFEPLGLERLAMGVRTRDDRPGLDEFGPTVSIVGRGAGDSELAVTLAVGVRGRHRSAAKADAVVSAVIARLKGGRSAPPDFEGLCPEAMRVSEVSGLEPLMRGPATVSWAFPSAGGRDLLVVDAAPLGAGAEERIALAARAASGPERGEARPYVSTGWIRLGEAIERAGPLHEMLFGERSPPGLLASIERVAWRIWPAEGRSGEIVGEFEVDQKAP